MRRLRTIAAGLRGQTRTGTTRLLPSLVAGAFAGMLCIMAQTSFAVLIFAGDLAPYVARGLGLTLLAAAVMNLVVAFGSSLPGVVTNPQDGPAAILTVSAAAIAGRLPAGSTAQEMLATVLATIALMSLVAGVFFLLLGWFRQGGLVRYVPYPVVGGFLAGIGWLLVQGSVGVMAGAPLTLGNLPALLQPQLLVRWLPGLAFALVTLLALRRWSHFLILPSLVLAAVALFYVVVWLSGVPLSALWAQVPGAATQGGSGGWLLGPFPSGGLWQPLTPGLLRQVHWPSVLAQAGSMGTILVISAVSLLLNASSLELLARRDVNLNRELKAAGVANLLAGLSGGGPVGFQTLSISSLSYRMGAPSRLVGVIAAALCGVMLLVGPSLLSFVPRVVPGGLILFVGLAFLLEWLYDAWPRLSRLDYGIVVLILIVTATLGILEGVGLGLAVAVFLFVLEYSRVGAVHRALSASALRSNVDRPRQHDRLLREKGDWLFVLELQGYLFFGTAHGLLQRVRDRLARPDRPAPHYVVLDFRRVSGIDVSAVLSFSRMAQLARSRNLTLVLTDLSPTLQGRLERELLQEDGPASWHVFPDLDHGLEWCEDQVLAQLQAAGEALGWFDETTAGDRRPETMRQVRAYMERLSLEPEQVLIHQGEPTKGLYFIEEGQVTIRLEMEGGESMRLRTRGPGTVVGEVGLYLGTPATASVVVEGACTVYRLSAEALDRMEAQAPELAFAFHRAMASHLSDRLASTTEIVQALMA
ncbi:MAG TPA: SulP family inorganic anion transporter [Anaerolineae bacterium]|nr:SulP family inorganic anion transporter [Anaerolineae bacterium]